MIQDIHSRTYYSFCGKDRPEDLVEKAIAGGIDLLGICDHNYGIGYGRTGPFCAAEGSAPTDYERTLRRYFDHIDLLRRHYADRITILRGIEVCTLADASHLRYTLPEGADISYFDYCLIENLDSPISCTGGDIFAYAQRCGAPVVGIAHTDLFAHIAHLGEQPEAYLRRMAEAGIFWELNVNYDSTHHYREHAYVADFFADEAKIEAVRRSGVRIGIGFDGHKIEDYLPDRVAEYNRRLDELGIAKPFGS